MYFTKAILQLCEWKCVHNFHMSPYVRLIGRLVCQGRAALYNIITSLEQVLFGDNKAHRPKWSDIFGTEVFIPFLRAVSSVHMLDMTLNSLRTYRFSEHLFLGKAKYNSSSTEIMCATLSENIAIFCSHRYFHLFAINTKLWFSNAKTCVIYICTILFFSPKVTLVFFHMCIVHIHS